MHTTALSAGALAKGDAELTAAERLGELAAILAAGVLRLKTRPESPPPGQAVASGTRTGGSAVQAAALEPMDASPETPQTCLPQAEKLSESPRNCLDVSARPRTHVPAT